MRPGAAPQAERERIVDLVFAPGEGRDRRARRGTWIALASTLLLYVVIAGGLLRTELSLENWSADLAARVHAEVSRHEDVELEAPPVVAAPEPPAPAQPVEAPPIAAPPPASPVARAERAAASPPVAAQAAQVITREASPDEPADYTGDAIVTGTAKAYAGGSTSAAGRSTTAVRGAASAEDEAGARRGAEGAVADRAQPVGLDEDDWRCPWPPEADAEEIDEQSALVRVVVGAEGRVESVEVVRDPGHGFGAAAAACARQARFHAALDGAGRPVRASSPAIRVRFVR